MNFFLVQAWKSYSRPQNFSFWGFYLQNLGAHLSDPQKALPWAERRVLSPHWFRSDAQCARWPWQRKQNKERKKKRQWQTGYSPRPPTSPYRSQSLHAGWPPVCSSIFQVLLKIGPVVLPLWVVENRPSPITLAIGLYNSLYYRTSHDCELLSSTLLKQRFEKCITSLWHYVFCCIS